MNETPQDRGPRVLALPIRPKVQSESVRADSLYSRFLPQWARRAACAGRDTDDFYPESRKTLAEEIESSWVAKRICAGCPVRAECLEQAFVMGDDHGVFGGATPGQRRLVENDPDRVFLLLTELEVEMLWADDRERVAV